jgi:hypothetical protein
MPALGGPDHDAHIANLQNLALKGKAKGDALANLVGHILANMPGVSGITSSRKDAFNSQEVDIVFEQEPHPDGFPKDDKIPRHVIVECKNLAEPASAMDVAWFYYKLKTRGLGFGILISSRGLTGSRGRGSAAQDVIKTALLDKVCIIAMNGTEVAQCTDTADFIVKVKVRISELVLDRTQFC